MESMDRRHGPCRTYVRAVPCRRIGPSLGRAAKSKDDRSTCRPRLYIVARFVISEQVLICYHIYLVAEYVVAGVPRTLCHGGSVGFSEASVVRVVSEHIREV